MTTYAERVQTYHEKVAKIATEYGSDYHEGYDRTIYWQSVGYGKPSIVDTISNHYIESRDDLEVWISYHFELFKPLPKRKGVIGTPSYKLIKNYIYFILKNEAMEDLLCYYGECMDARRQNLSWIKNGGKKR